MSVDFNALLTLEQKQAILANNIQQFAAQGYTLKLNREAIEKANPEDLQDRLAAIDADIKTVESATDVYQAALADLK
jgi:hypothetical protein